MQSCRAVAGHTRDLCTQGLVPMTPRKNIVLIALVLCLLGQAWSTACAEESAGAILVLGVVEEDHLDSRLTESLERYLRSTEQIISSHELHREERKCREPRCLYELAQRKHAVMLLGAHVTRADKNEVEIALYLLHSASRTWRRTGDLVAADQVAERLNQLTRQLLRGPVAERPHAKSAVSHTGPRLQVPNVMMRLLQALPPQRLPIPAQRKSAGISLIVLGSLVVGAAAVFGALAPGYGTPERCFANYNRDCTDRVSPTASIGYSAGAGIALAGIITLTIPSYKKAGL